MTLNHAKSKTDFAEFFKSNDLFPAMDDAQVYLAAENCAVESYTKGELVLSIDHEYEALKILYHGSVDVVLENQESAQEFVVASLEPGAYFGEKGFMEMGHPSANIVASGNVMVLAISRTDAVQLGFYHNIVKGIASVQSERLRIANSKQIEALQMAIERQSEQNSFGRFYIATIMLFAISSFVPDYSNESPAFQLMIRWVFLALILIPAIYAVRNQNVPISVFGITTTGWRISVLESVLVSVAILPVLILFKILGAPADEPLITWGAISNYSGGQLAFYLATYVPHSAIQEFIARGVGQGSLQRFMPDAHFMKPIVIAGMLFAILHLHLSISAAVFTFFVSLLFGYLYYRHKTLIGVTVMHVLLGISATALGVI